MNTIVTARHRVAIAGMVIDGITGKAIAGAEIAMTGTPAAFARGLGLRAIQFGAKWSTMAERPDRTRSRGDGSFYFLDLPDGEYGLRIAAPGFGSRYGAVDRKATVAPDANGEFKLDWAVVALPPTMVKGAITSADEGVCFANVRVKGSGESAFSDRTGQYLIAGIEPGRRTLLVSAQGFRPVAQIVSITAPGAVLTMNFGLQAETGPETARATDRAAAQATEPATERADVQAAEIPQTAEPAARTRRGRQHGG